MSTEIDWSKAPEGATHWDSRGNACSIGFMKPGLRKNEWEYFGCGGHWVLYGVADSELLEDMVTRPTPWSGEGLPPVGTVCNASFAGIDQGLVRVEYMGKNACVLYSLERHEEQCSMVWRYVFSPVKTPEQIEAEQRREAIADMVYSGCGADKDGNNTTAFILCGLLYDAGYRKVEGGAA